ncbi:uncharacterized protein BDZ99DRAFT_484715 [Mytilinidion resinicola]|uniref:Uncharacterized protein n=1 Tax=Mytilinidion resinicola TaxID=574789 RepID=A0A6A6Z6H5_9PEZI|nr:uncharacterized protein BDZ99DRAFT_484715 [Mytilinidion resinicola]KAF2815894.1 hypothetical protein BDZ99DRAFT_484715 [Mytilinidion resinicola]
MPLGLFLGGCIVAIPVVTGVAEGVSEQKKQNEEANNEERMIKFNLEVFCGARSPSKDQVHGTIVVLRHNKAWLCPQIPETHTPIPQVEGLSPPLHPFAGFYIQYPDDNRSPPQRGLVSTISDDPPMLNWLYADKETQEIKYGNRTASIEHLVGDWDWTEDHAGLLLEKWEGFVAVDEGEEGKDGLKWALYYDRYDDKLDKGNLVGGQEILEVSLERRVQSAEQQLKQMEEAEKKMQVKSSGGMSSQFTAPAAEAKRKAAAGKKN